MTMKGANFLEQLLDGQKVEWKKLGEVCNVQRGRRLTKKDMIEDGEYLVYQNSMIPLGRYNKYNVKGGTTYVICAGSAGEIGYSSEDFWAADDVSYFECPEFVHSKFVYYYLLTQQQRILRQVRKAGVPRLAPDVLRQLPIPLPSLSVQSRIVEILDKFTSLEAELEAELELRTKQYQHYREQLLDFSEENKGYKVEWKKLGEVCTKVCSGGTPSTKIKEYYKGNIPWLRTQDIDWKDVYDTEVKITEEAVNNSSAQLIPANCVIVAMYGATAAKACINRIPLTTNQACCNLLVDESIANYKYVYYWICREYERLRALGEGCQSNLSGKKIKDYIIPLPPLSVQSRIVEILDKFDTLTNSITEGLPLEIKLRKQQYEYYREQLLDFRR